MCRLRSHQRLDRRRRDRPLARQQLPQRFLDARLTLPCCQVQNPQVLLVRVHRLLAEQRVVGHAEVARWEQFLPVAVVRERARLPHQPVDDVPVVDAVLVPATQTRQALDELLGVPHFQVFHVQPYFDQLADQSARHRVTVPLDVNETAGIDARLQTLARLQSPRRQAPQLGSLLHQPLPPTRVELVEQSSQEGRVVFATAEVSSATQHQRLIDCLLETPVALLDVAVLVGMVRLDLLARHPIVTQ